MFMRGVIRLIGTRKRAKVSALAMGLATEGLFTAFGLHRIGPCGPASMFSMIWFLAHIPGFFVVNALHIGESASMAAVFASYSFLFAVAWYNVTVYYFRNALGSADDVNRQG